MTGMENDVLVIFETEWHDRQAAIQSAVERLGASHKTPRLEPFIDRKGRERFTLVRTDGEVARLTGRTRRAVTTRFTPEEWAMIERVVLLRHGLALADLDRGESND